jgi:hypothetical protein
MKSRLGKIDGKTLKGWVAWLREKDCGCCHKAVGLTDLHEVDVCVGWHDCGDGPKENGYRRWVVAWKIGWQTFDNGMQTDFDIDFDMPYPCNEQGDVYDTVSEIGEIKSMKDWNRLAAEINRTAKDVFERAVEIDGKAAGVE